MVEIHQLSDTQVVLLAARLISEVEVEQLQTLTAARRDVLTDSRLCRLLLTLYPHSEITRSALLALLRGIDIDFDHASTLDGELGGEGSVQALPQDVADQEAQVLFVSWDTAEHIRLKHDCITSFIIQFARLVEQMDGNLADVLPLVEEFASSRPDLLRWAHAYLLPVIHLQYQFYPDDVNVVTLRELENSSGLAAIRALLRCTAIRSPRTDVARDIEEVVVPWLSGLSDEDSFSGYQALNTWIFETSKRDFELASQTLLQWRPRPSRPELIEAYAQTGVAVMCAAPTASSHVLQTCTQVLQRVCRILDIDTAYATEDTPEIAANLTSLPAVSENCLMQSSLMAAGNELTKVTNATASFWWGVLKTAHILTAIKLPVNISDIALTCIADSGAKQRQEANRIVQQIPRLTSNIPPWTFVREQLLWLHAWSPHQPNGHARQSLSYLGKIDLTAIDEITLDCMLAQGKSDEVKQIYVQSKDPPLPLSTVEDRIVTAVLSLYDSASNGNRFRGAVKRASDILTAFKSIFARSARFSEIEHLVKATHSLSFYTLTLQHGVPLQPVNIRAQQNPLDLIIKVLEQDTRAYTKVDDLLEIGRHLVLAHLRDDAAAVDDVVEDDEEQVQRAQREIIYRAITSALAAHDFDTAYSYITTRLSAPPGSSANPFEQDDTSWRAAYAAGRYRPQGTPDSLHDRISSLSKRMDLLSLALILVPTTEPLSEILAQWRRSEEEMESLKSQALEEERAFELRGDGLLPGGFEIEDRAIDANETRKMLAKRSLAGNSATFDEQAPLSLFEVASGAARALSRSTKGLRGMPQQDGKLRDSQLEINAAKAVTTDDNKAGKVRRRDMVSNMVTSSLVNSMGWVLGAQPPDKGKDEHG